MAIDPLTAILDIGKVAIERIWPDPDKRAIELRKLEELKQQGKVKELEFQVQLMVGQMQINQKEAESKSLFVAGWRPFCGWCGGLGLAYATIIEPIARFIAKINGYTGEFPVLDTTLTMQILMGMLGLGIMRSFDKKNKVETNSLETQK